MNILIIGAPGSGKGTMSELITDKYRIVHVSTGDMLRSAVKSQSSLGKKAQGYIEQGLLVPDELVNDIILERLDQQDVKNGFLLDGYPRTMSQAIAFDEILKKLGLHIDAVLDMAIDEEVLKDRITGRRVCPNCQSIYHITNLKPKVAGICDRCGHALITRKDDTLESLKVRLDAYHQQTTPILGYYQKQGLLKTIDANKPKAETFAEISTILERLK